MTYFEFLNWIFSLFSFTDKLDQKSGTYFDVVPYFTKFTIQKVNKAFVYMTDWTCPLTPEINLLLAKYGVLKISKAQIIIFERHPWVLPT